MPLGEMTLQKYNGFVLHLKEEISNDVSINSYLRDLIATLQFLMDEGHVKTFKMKAIKVDRWTVETYTDEELRTLLKKPPMKSSTFMEYQSWMITTFLFSTGVRQRSLLFIRIKDVDFDNNVVTIRVTKNRKLLIIPMNSTLAAHLREYLRHRQYTPAKSEVPDSAKIKGRFRCWKDAVKAAGLPSLKEAEEVKKRLEKRE